MVRGLTKGLAKPNSNVLKGGLAKQKPNVAKKPPPKAPVAAKKPPPKAPVAANDTIPTKKRSFGGAAGGLGVVAGLGVATAAIVSDQSKKDCVEGWKRTYLDLWETDEKSTLEALLKHMKANATTGTDERRKKAYEELEKCKGRDFFGNAVGSLLSPFAGALGDSLETVIGPVKWVLVALLCALAVGLAYKAYTVVVARRAALAVAPSAQRLGDA
jgi:hypothetical protein